MNRMNFMDRLAALLSDLPEDERREAIEYYNDYLNDAGVENEGEVLAALGTPEELAASIREGLQDAQGQQGVFSEDGFRTGSRARGNELAARPGSGQGRGETAGTADPRAAAGLESGAQGPGERTERAGTGPAGGTAFDRTEEKPRDGEAQRSGAQEARGADGGRSRDLNGRYRGNKGGKHMSGGMIALLVVLAVFALPVIIAVGIGLLTALVVLALAVIFFAVVFLFGGVILICAGLICLAASVAKLAAFPAAALLSMGISFLCIGSGIFLTLAIGWVVTKLFPPLFRKAANGVRAAVRRK